MKTYAPQEPRRPRHIRVPAFVPVRRRARVDGWNEERQAKFLVVLTRTRSVSEAARAVGMARESAYRLRKAPGGEAFSAAWDAAMGCHHAGRRKVTPVERIARAFGELVKPMVWRGDYCGIARKVDNSALLGHFSRLERETRRGGALAERSQSFAGTFASGSRTPRC